MHMRREPASHSAEVSVSGTGGLPLIGPADAVVHRSAGRIASAELPWAGIAAAALQHLALLAWLLLDRSEPLRLDHKPVAIPVSLVFAAPPETPASAPPPLANAESGPDQRTTLPPPSDSVAPEPATPPQPAPQSAAPEPAPVPAEKPSPRHQATQPKPSKEVARLEPAKRESDTLQAPSRAPLRRLNVAPGERLETGDPYLNQLHDLIERHRVYPRVMGPFGLPVEGTAVFGMALDRSGRVLEMRLEHSSGAAGIDHAVENMIRSSVPFPPLPSNYPDAVVIVVTVRLFPPSS